MAFNKAKALQEAEKSLAQGKTSQAIKLYLDIYSKDPADPTLLNTIGDLYLREKNLSEALKHFHKLAESYTQEGFTIKAIAIYKKISRLDANNVDVLVKTGELYTVQGLSREAREQFTQAVEFLRKKNQNDRAVEVFRKIVALDPDNPVYRAKFANFCEETGRKSDAASAYRESAEIAFRKGDLAGSETALGKASSLDSKDPKILVLRARLALAKNQPAEAEKILTSSPAVKSDRLAQKLLLESYLGAKRLTEAKALVGEVFRANPAEFAPLETFARLCLEKSEYDTAVAPLSEASDALIQQKSTGPMMEILREIWTREPHHLPALELIYKVAEKTADETTLPEVLQALGDAYAGDGNLERAEWAFRKLVDREPENEDYKALLRGILRKAGKEVPELSIPLSGLSGGNLALTADTEASAAPFSGAVPVVSEEEAAMVKEALENSDLFSRYNLADKAVAELEKVLASYPEQIEIHRRILEVSQKSLPDRAKQAAEALAKIYARRGDLVSARRYEAQTGKELQLEKVAPAPPPVVPMETPAPPAAPPAMEAVATEIDLSAEFPGFETAEAPARPGVESPVEVPLDIAPTAAMNAPAAEAHEEIDLSEALGVAEAPPVEAPPAAPAFNFEESRVEVEFYLEQGFVEEARKAVQALEERFPGNAQVAGFRNLVESCEAGVPAAALNAEAQVTSLDAAPGGPPVALEPTVESAPIEASTPVPAELIVSMDAPAAPATPEPVPAMAASSPETSSPSLGGDFLGSLAGDLASSLEGIEGKASAGSPPPLARSGMSPPTGTPPAAVQASSPLSGILEEFGDAGEAPAEDDPQTHYDLGVAFREMNLLDEAIGEFQKVVKGAQRDKLPANFLQACTLLALCFMDKKMPVIAAKWYVKALEIPALDEEATLALLYDLGVAYEQAGNTRTALEKFSEVYSQNIDYRDVAEKIRILQQKA